MAAPQRDPAAGALANPSTTGTDAPSEVLPRASSALRSRLGQILSAITIIAVLLAASGAPGAVRGPFVLAACLFLPGYPYLARLDLDIATLLALDLCASLALEGGLALLMVEARIWHPQYLGLALAVYGVGGTFVTLTALRHAEAEHLRRPPR